MERKKMKAFELYLSSGNPAGVFCCSNCNIVHRMKTSAESCCVCVDCKKNLRKRYNVRCEKCDELHTIETNKLNTAKEAEIFTKAETVTEFKYVWYNEKLYSDLDTIIEDCDDDNTKPPEYVFLMKPVYFTGFELEAIFDNANEEHMCEDVDIRDRLSGIKELREAFMIFNEDNKNSVVYWIADETKKVKVS